MKKQILGAATLLTAGVLAGSVISMAGAANAASTTDSSNSSSSSSSTPAAPNGAAPANQFSSTPVRSDEKAVAAADAATLQAAAEAKVPGATAFRIETDGDGAAYEVHMKKADGTVVTVKFDKNLAVTGVETGFGAGGPNGGPGAGGHGPGDNDGDGPHGPNGNGGSNGGNWTPGSTTTPTPGTNG